MNADAQKQHLFFKIIYLIMLDLKYFSFALILLQITSTLTFAAACASAGITVLIGNDLNDCAENHCSRFETATAMAFMSWFAASPSFLLNFWTLASKQKQQRSSIMWDFAQISTTGVLCFSYHLTMRKPTFWSLNRY